MPKKNQTVSKRARGKTQSLGFVTYQGKPLMPVADWIDFHCRQFEETNNPLDLLEAFIASVQASVYPPPSILLPLSKAFQTVLEGQGEKDLDAELGLRGIGSGAWSIFTKKKKDGTVHWLATVIFILTNLRDENGKKISQEKAADRVSFFLESNPQLKLYKVEGLLDTYSRIWKKRFGFDRVIPTDNLHPASWTPARRAAFLQNYPSRNR